MKNTPTSPRTAKGFTLIEILITLVIFSIGLLGMAGMQLRGSEGTNMAYFRSQATLIANDMAERMHANRAGVDANDYENLSTVNVCANGVNPICATRGGVPGADCPPDEMAAFDLFTIACSVEDLLPPGSLLTVTCNDNPNCVVGSPHTVAIAWSEVNEGQALTRDVTLVVQP